MIRPGWSAWVAAWLLAALTGCTGGGGGGGGGDFEGCGSDADCKGDRVCEEGMCVDPDPGDGDGDSGDGDGDSGDGDGASGDGDGDTTSGDGDGDGGGRPVPNDDPELEAACMRDCQARWDAACEMDIQSLDQCNAQCLIIDEANGGYCNGEQRAQYACLAAGGYSCVNGYARADSTCVLEQTAVSECAQHIPCWRLCDDTDGLCAADRDACVQDCDEDLAQLNDIACSHYYNQLLSCWGQQEPLVCQGDRPTIEPCRSQAAEVADCMNNRQMPCEGFCWAAGMLGCGDGCLATCQPRLDDPACGYEYERLLDCALSYNDLYLQCVNGTPAVTAECQGEITNYQSCIAGP